MATDNEGGSSGGPKFLSKVARFVRNPLTQWNEIDETPADSESRFSKAALKEMIERKRRNDFVRRREFDHLRRLRSKEGPIGGEVARPSFFHSSLSSKPDDREGTLKKIDEIEAQMSQSWWKSKGVTAAEAARYANSVQAGINTQPGTLVPTLPNAQAAAPSGGSAARHGLNHPGISSSLRASLEAVDQVAAALDGPAAGGVRAAAAARSDSADSSPPGWAATAPMDFGAASRELAMGQGHAASPGHGFGMQAPAVPTRSPLEPFTHDALLEEAAIRFANGDATGAEEALKAAVVDAALLGPASNEAVWEALFDLYRATGQTDRFDAATLEFASVMSRSPPGWVSLPERLRHQPARTPRPSRPRSPSSRAAALPGAASAPGAGVLAEEQAAELFAGQGAWRAPARLTEASLTPLGLSPVGEGRVIHVDWSAVQSIDDSAAPGLARLLSLWSESAVQLRMAGSAQLDAVLRARTPTGQSAVAPEWWQLRLDALRLGGHVADFEEAALEYCMTFEVSPPQWQAPRCQCVAVDPESGDTMIEAPPSRIESGASVWNASTVAMGHDDFVLDDLSADLSGTLQGEISDTIDALQAAAEGTTTLQVRCELLLRVDFAAAGALLNWAAAAQGTGQRVHFVGLHRIVATFFNVIGINESATVSIRVD